MQTADFINQAGILLWQGLAIFSQQFPEGIVYQGLWPIFIAEQSVTRKEPPKNVRLDILCFKHFSFFLSSPDLWPFFTETFAHIVYRRTGGRPPFVE
ncbi:hypothetical protein [Endozoicomonas sp. SCSIO W0465]|uniref:hypothetical protein n=1 Tax=Endozoicomonas sp. SCSIO W0465 TaxID=2918516 RepID=UPI0020757CAB|nr:hypothetical protein [Endozoicomonas sp. SCSIO W0465]USE38967.1 hypothetical protein MJO57_12850 [Endozoicomonas sp. SCSIO W0465]